MNRQTARPASARPSGLVQLCARRWLALTIALVFAISTSLYAGTHANVSALGDHQITAGALGDGIACESHADDHADGNDRAPTDDGCCMASAVCALCIPVTAVSVFAPDSASQGPFGLSFTLTASAPDLQLRPPKALNARLSARARFPDQIQSEFRPDTGPGPWVVRVNATAADTAAQRS